MIKRNHQSRKLPPNISNMPLVHIDLDNFEDYRNSIHEELNLKKFDIYLDCLPRILQMLSKHSTKAILFVVGRDLSVSPNALEILRKAIKAGHEIGNHTMNHPKNFIDLDYENRTKEIRDCHTAIKSKLGINPKFYRAPGYAFRRDDIKVLSELDYEKDFSKTSFFYKLLTQVYFIVKSKKSKNFFRTKNFFSQSLLKKDGVNFTEQNTKIHKPQKLTSISTTWFHELSKTKSKISLTQRIAQPIILLHAIDFLDLEDVNSLIPALRIPLNQRLALIEDKLSKLSQ